MKSHSSDRISNFLQKNSCTTHRGVTILHGKGAFTGKSEEILYTVITLAEISKLKRLVKEIDPDVFMVISDTAEVTGKRIGNQPHW